MNCNVSIKERIVLKKMSTLKIKKKIKKVFGMMHTLRFGDTH